MDFVIGKTHGTEEQMAFASRQPESSTSDVHRLAIVVVALVVALLASTGRAADGPEPESPASGDAVYAPHPHFRWRREGDVRIDDVHHVQIARDERFADLAVDDRVQVVSRFVPAAPLPPGRYWWRVRREAGEWSPSIGFEVRDVERAFTIRAGSDAADVGRIFQEAAAAAPARVDFEPGDYRLETTAEEIARLRAVKDLIIDGHGARLVLSRPLVSLHECARVTFRRLTITADRPGHTLVRIAAKGDGHFLVRPEEGYAPDVPRYFEREGNGGSFLGCMDVDHHGLYIPGAGVSVREVGIEAVPGTPVAFRFQPVPQATLDRMPLGAPAVVTVYHWQWVRMYGSAECTFSDVTVIDLPGAFCGGSNNSAKSYLNCRVRRREPEDFYGGHAATGSGRVGEWIEGCHFECLPDDGPAQQSFRVIPLGMDESDAVFIGGHLSSAPFKPGDRIAVVNPRTQRGTAATVRATSQVGRQVRIQFDRQLTDLAAEVGGAAPADWTGMHLFRDTPSNEDFVYRRNRHVGSRGHGLKFNGTRAWIADSHFENINGNAVLAGYVSEVSGHGARDVLVSGNTIIRCGWTPIEARSTSGLGGNIIIRDNRIDHVRDAAVSVQRCADVIIEGNRFSSPTPPVQGAWIVAVDAGDVTAEANEADPGVPEFKRVVTRKP